MDWQKLSEVSTKVGYKWVTDKTFRQPDGTEAVYTTWHKTGSRSAAVVALTTNDKLVIAKQFRPGSEKMMYELPGGVLEAGEDPAQAAARELLEETGYASDQPLEFLGSACSDAYTNNTNHFYLARNCQNVSEQHLDDGEFVEVVLLDIGETLEYAKTGLMSDAIALLCAYDKLRAIAEKEK